MIISDDSSPMNWSARKEGEANGKEEKGAEKVDKTLVEHEALVPPRDVWSPWWSRKVMTIDQFDLIKHIGHIDQNNDGD